MQAWSTTHTHTNKHWQCAHKSAHILHSHTHTHGSCALSSIEFANGHGQCPCCMPCRTLLPRIRVQKIYGCPRSFIFRDTTSGWAWISNSAIVHTHTHTDTSIHTHTHTHRNRQHTKHLMPKTINAGNSESLPSWCAFIHCMWIHVWILQDTNTHIGTHTPTQPYTLHTHICSHAHTHTHINSFIND